MLHEQAWICKAGSEFYDLRRVLLIIKLRKPTSPENVLIPTKWTPSEAKL